MCVSEFYVEYEVEINAECLFVIIQEKDSEFLIIKESRNICHFI